MKSKRPRTHYEMANSILKGHASGDQLHDDLHTIDTHVISETQTAVILSFAT